MIETQVYAGQTFSWWPCECQWRSTLRATYNCDKWRRHGACALCCAKWRTNEYSRDIRGCRNNSWKCSHYSLQRQHLVPKMITLERKESRITDLELSSYYPDLSSSDFFLFTRLKRFLKKKHRFTNAEKVDAGETREMRRELKNRFQECFKNFTKTKIKLNAMAWVRERTTLTEGPLLVDEVSANVCG
jgi:hypothetical protein